MATGNIRRTGGKRNYAKVTPPSTSTATTAADTTSVTIAILQVHLVLQQLLM